MPLKDVPEKTGCMFTHTLNIIICDRTRLSHMLYSSGLQVDNSYFEGYLHKVKSCYSITQIIMKLSILRQKYSIPLRELSPKRLPYTLILFQVFPKQAVRMFCCDTPTENNTKKRFNSFCNLLLIMLPLAPFPFYRAQV